MVGRMEPRYAYRSRFHVGRFQPGVGFFANMDQSNRKLSPPRPIADQSAQARGCAVMPDCAHMWRSAGPGTQTSHIYAAGLPEDFSIGKLRSLATEGGNMVRQFGGVVHRISGNKGVGAQRMNPEIEFLHTYRKWCPIQYPAMVGILDQGVRAHYGRGDGTPPLVRGIPYNLPHPDHPHMISQEFSERHSMTTAIRAFDGDNRRSDAHRGDTDSRRREKESGPGNKYRPKSHCGNASG